MRRILIAIAICMVVVGTIAAPVMVQAQTSVESNFMSILNIERASLGESPLTINSSLSSAAYLHSKDMAENNYFSHTSRDGTTFDQRIVAAGYTNYTDLSENIAYTYGYGAADASTVYNMWKNSPGHYANMTGPFAEAGLGVYSLNGYSYYTLDLGSRAKVPPPTVTFTITVSSGLYGTVTPGTGSVSQGSTPGYSVKASSGYHVADVKVDGSSVGAVSSYIFSPVYANHSISAIFAANPTNQPPVLAPIGNKTVATGQNLNFTVSGTGPELDPLTYSATNLPPGAIFNASTRTFSWTPASTQVGTYSNVFFQVSDGHLTDYEYINITVNASVVNGQISGIVRNSATGLGIGGATVSDGYRTVTTASTGTYTISNVPAGKYTVSVLASSYQNAVQTATVLAGNTASANFTLLKSTSSGMWIDSITFVPGATDMTLKVKVVNPAPVAKAAILIGLLHNGVSTYYYTITDSTGVASFRISPASDGSYTASVLNLTMTGLKWDTTKGIKTASFILSR